MRLHFVVGPENLKDGRFCISPGLFGTEDFLSVLTCKQEIVRTKQVETTTIKKSPVPNKPVCVYFLYYLFFLSLKLIETTKIGMVWKNLKFHHPPSQFGTLATYVQLHASFLEDIPIYPVDPCDNHNVVNHRTKWAMASSTRWHYQRVHVQMAYLAHPGSLHADFFFQTIWANGAMFKTLFVDDSMGLCYPKEVGTTTTHFQKSVLTQCKGTVKELGGRASPCSRSTGQFYCSRFWLRNVIGTFR